jgi:hypothetical protein
MRVALGWGALVLVLVGSACVLARSGTASDGSGGGSSASSAGGGLAVSQVASSSTGTPTAEDCLNRSDDDGDGMVDCEDDDCADYVCLDGVPGAIAYVLVDQDSCPPTTSTRELRSCVGCACSGTMGTCGVSATSYDGVNCTGDTDTTTATGCWDSDNIQIGFRGSTAILTPGLCAETAAMAAAQDPGACVVDAGLCAAQICVHQELAEGLCALIDTDTPCPIGMVTTDLYESDGATCDCSCQKTEGCTIGNAEPSGVTDACDLAPLPGVAMDGNCKPVAPSDSFEIPVPVPNIQCAPGGVPTPPAQATPVRLCCPP